MKEINKAEQNVFDRIGQTFELFKDNFIGLFIPFFIYSSWMIAFMIFITDFILKLIKEFINNPENWEFFDKIIELSQDSTLVDNKDFINNIIQNTIVENWPEILMNNLYSIIWYSVWFIITIISIIIIFIAFSLATIKWIKQAYNWEKVYAKNNIKYWFKNLLNSFKVYWYLFLYILLIPAVIFIVWWITLNYWLFNNTPNITWIWIWIMSLSIFIYIFFAIYRWIKASFYMSSAIDKNEFTKENFNFSIKITKNNWWRILWNFLLIWLIIGFWVSMLNSILWWIMWSSFNIKELLWEDIDIKSTISNIINSYSISHDIISRIIFASLDIASRVIILIFTYILFKRLEIENNLETKKEENIEL